MKYENYRYSTAEYGINILDKDCGIMLLTSDRHTRWRISMQSTAMEGYRRPDLYNKPLRSTFRGIDFICCLSISDNSKTEYVETPCIKQLISQNCQKI